MEADKIKLKTADNYEIIGDFYAAKDKKAPAVVLSHMMPATKESWKEFVQKLNQNGFHCLAIDLRGHGESQDGPEGFKNFTDIQHQDIINDLEAAVNLFLKTGLPMEKIIVGGASIGANLSLRFQAEHPEIKSSILLSPGLDYKGIETEKLAKKLNFDQAIFLAAGGRNDEYSTETAAKLINLAKSENKIFKIFENAGHGTTMFKEEPSLMNEITEWLKNIYFPL